MTTWDSFFKEKTIDIFTSSKEVIDIGGGLRVDGAKGNRVDNKRAWLASYVEKVSYKTLDPVPDYNPDIVGDIHDLPFKDGAIDAILCIAVLEHVRNPFKAMDEMYRSLKRGGKLLVYVPFLYYYHAHEGYYKDYWRYTYDGLEELSKQFSYVEIERVRDRFETLCRLTPFGRFEIIVLFSQWLDRMFPKESRQVSGYYLYAVK